jgi:hypothetical protein
MTTTTNIQMNSNGNNGNGAALNQNNNLEEVARMTITNHIQGIFKNNMKVMAGIFVGGMMVLAAILPGPALGDTPANPNTGSVMTSVGMEFPDQNDSLPWVAKAYAIMEFPDVDDSLPSVTKAFATMEFPDQDDSLPSVTKAFASLETADADDYDSLLKRITVLQFPSDSEIV